MSRARAIIIEEEEFWFDTRRHKHDASIEQLELLASVEDKEMDDLLDEALTQRQVYDRLHEALGTGQIPAAVLMRRNAARVMRQHAPQCRMCDQEGQSTRHHFVNKWMMRELSTYREDGARSKCTIPVCIGCHRDLHDRSGITQSIVPFLGDEEKKFACRLIEQLRREKPKVFGLLLEGDPNVYEARLIQDWADGLFDGVEG